MPVLLQTWETVHIGASEELQHCKSLDVLQPRHSSASPPACADGKASDRQPRAVQGLGLISPAVWMGPLPPTSPGQLRSRLSKLLDASAIQDISMGAEGTRALVTLADLR